MMQLRLTPGTASAGGTRIFIVRQFNFDAQTRELVLHLRDGKMALQLVGLWQIAARPTQIIPHTVAEAEAIHDERTSPLVMV